MNLRLLELRKQKGWTQAEVAEKLKITPQAYSLYETSKNNINNEMLCMLADIFEVSTDYLLGRQNERPSFLSEEERSIINQYRALDERGKENIKHSLAFEYARNSNVTASKKKVKSS
ncbi:MAG: helix-turn-helix transcriptional regulator [Clostridia bacterium]|nr:helix-turn-helix transcriptional regulator [Clostridia bacterium]